MFIKRSIILILLLYILFCFFPQNVFAKSKNPGLATVTVINPIRGPELGLERVDLLSSLKGQWGVVQKLGIKATWLWQYSALTDEKLTEFAKSNMKEQEFGIFLEIDHNSADKAGVKYRGKGPWYFSDGLFLTSYETDDREKLITRAFEDFKKTFGYYPKTVGAWWVGADSIQFMQKKYGITAVLQCADQFDTDKYSIWGTPWSIPYLPSSRNAAIPSSSSLDNIPGVVVLQWATRDPLNAYGSSVNESTYSIQDFTMKGYSAASYLSYIKNIYLKKPLDNIVIGLESGFPDYSYKGAYQQELQVIKDWETDGKINIQTAKEYSAEFINKKQIYPPTHYFLSKGYQTNDQSFWYHSPNYRVGIQKKGKEVSLIDFRDYNATSEEDFYVLPNTQSLLRINTKALVDSARFPDVKIVLAQTDKELAIQEHADRVDLLSGGKLVATFNIKGASFYNLKDNAVNLFPQQFTKNKNSTSITFFQLPSITPLTIVIVVILLYLVYLIYFLSNTISLKSSVFCLLFSLLVLFPIYSSGKFFSPVMEFTRYSLFLFPLMSHIPFDPAIKVFVIFQLLPIMLILLLHFFLTRNIKDRQIVLVIYFIFALLFFSYIDNYPQKIIEFITQGRKAKLIFLASSGLVAAGAFLLVRFYQEKKHKLLTVLLIAVCLCFIWTNKKTIFVNKSYIITPFEQEALQTIYLQQKKVIYLLPNFTADDFQSITPLLAIDKMYPEILTSTKWQEAPVVQHSFKLIQDDNLLVAPRYLGVDIGDDSFKKIFDNAQIIIYRRK